MHRHPVVQALLRRKLTTAMLVIEIALTFAVAANVLSVVSDSFLLMNEPSGVDEASVGIVKLEQGVTARPGVSPAETVLRARAVPGVASAAWVRALPFAAEVMDSIFPGPDADDRAFGVSVSEFAGGPGAIRTLGLQLVAGRDFLLVEYIDRNSDAEASPDATILTEALARRLFGTPDATDRLVYTQSGASMRVVGIIKRLLRPHPVRGAGSANQYSLLLPEVPPANSRVLAFRTAGPVRGRVLQDIEGRLTAFGDIAHARSFAELRASYFRRDAEKSTLLLGATLSLLLVTAIGIGGLATFRVRQSRHSIAIRRAVGATKARIVLGFQAESAALAFAALLLGTPTALILNRALMGLLELQTLAPASVAMCALLILLVVQISSLGPSLKAIAVDPAQAVKRR